MSEIKKIKLSEIDNFRNHPFKVNNDDSLKELSNSIKENGLLNPLVVRKKDNNKYELISGHRRKLAMELIGIEECDCYIKELTDDEAIVEMVDSNMYREKILPSEKAFAYKMKMDAIKHQGRTLGTQYPKLRSSEIIAKESNDGEKNIRNHIRLTYLIPELLKLVDDTVLKDKRSFLTMGIKPAVELSYLTKDEQNLVYASITYEDLTPSHGQAIMIRKLSKNKELNFDVIEKILCQEKGNQKEKISFNKERIEDILPRDLLKRDKRYVEQYIIRAIEIYKKLELERGDDYDLE